MEFEIKAYQGAGPITFGMSPEETRRVLAGKVEALSNKSDSPVPTDFFVERGIMVYYTSTATCEAIEFFRPASPTFNGQHFIGNTYREMEHWVKMIDPEYALNDAGLTSYKFGFGLYAPSAMKEPELPVEGVIVFARGYYDD